MSAKRLLFPATFGTQHSSQMANLLDIIPKNVANTNVLVWGGRCLVLLEVGDGFHPAVGVIVCTAAQVVQALPVLQVGGAGVGCHD